MIIILNKSIKLLILILVSYILSSCNNEYPTSCSNANTNDSINKFNLYMDSVKKLYNKSTRIENLKNSKIPSSLTKYIIPENKNKQESRFIDLFYKKINKDSNQTSEDYNSKKQNDGNKYKISQKQKIKFKFYYIHIGKLIAIKLYFKLFKKESHNSQIMKIDYSLGL